LFPRQALLQCSERHLLEYVRPEDDRLVDDRDDLVYQLLGGTSRVDGKPNDAQGTEELNHSFQITQPF
jgi:hypothetical protein